MFNSMCCRLFAIACITWLAAYSNLVKAEQDSIVIQLESIEQLQDRRIALSKLRQLLDSDRMAAEQKFSVYIATMLTYQELNDLDTALSTANEALIFADNEKLAYQAATAHKMIGIFYYFRGDNDLALTAYEKALTQFIQLELPVQQANVYNNMGLVYAAIGENAKALNTYQSADALYQVHGDELDKVDIRFNIAGLHIHLKQYEVAIELLQEVIEKRLEMGNDEDLASAFADISIAYQSAREYQKSEHYMNLAFDYYSGQKNYYAMAGQYQNLASLYLRIGNYDKAYEHAQKAIEFAQLSGHKKVLSGGLKARSIGLFLQGKLDEAFIDLNASEKNARELNYTPSIIGGLSIKALVYAAQHEYSKSLQALYDYQYHINLINGANLNQQLAQFETEQLSQQIKDLEQTRQLQILEKEAQKRQWQYTTLISVITILVFFIFYQRRTEQQLKVKFEAEVTQRTTALELANQKLSDLSFLDNVTSLYNRRSFDIDLVGAWRRTIKYDAPFILVLASIDNFERFNERYGHLAGDDVARKISEIIKDQCQIQHKAYRFSDDEFAIIIESNDVNTATALIENVLREAYQLGIEHADSQLDVVTLSAGLCLSDDQVQSAEQLIDKADQRVYIAKKTGRNKVIGAKQ